MHYKKLFNKAEIEYITPFLKLWMSFNNWYKQDLVGIKIKVKNKNGNIKQNPDGTHKEKEIKTDADAINYYKQRGKIKDEFLRLFDERSDDGENLRIALDSLISNIKNYQLKYPNGDIVNYSNDLIYNGKIDGRKGVDGVWVSDQIKQYQIPNTRKEDLFSETLEIIYQVRSSLVHGDFDIENQYFLKLVEASYKILYPIMERILQVKTNEEFILISTELNVEAFAAFDNGKMSVLVGSKIRKDVDETFGNEEKRSKRQEWLRENAIENENYYELKVTREFANPSEASSFCLGYESNGWEDWKKNGKSINDIINNI